jgi:hypothetical protein
MNWIRLNNGNMPHEDTEVLAATIFKPKYIGLRDKPMIMKGKLVKSSDPLLGIECHTQIKDKTVRLTNLTHYCYIEEPYFDREDWANIGLRNRKLKA